MTAVAKKALDASIIHHENNLKKAIKAKRKF